ncbi:hypothetical protein HGRIS_009051 [Hohenbuehelia grisea]|uniref:Endonuclease/exonuclease/phosphatase domain-containing protein n=1 Tax=Hohenbuehelia grisea TaxID=104357 RepID=A0ABR3IZZ1_9AGAR
MSYASSDGSEPVIPNSLFAVRPSRYRRSKDAWKHVSISSSSSGSDDEVEPGPSMVRVVTWNVEFNDEECEERLATALEYLRCDIFRCDDGQDPDDSVILLQEVNTHAFSVLLEDDWIRANYAITPVSPRHWPEHAAYGNVTLVSRKIDIVFAGVLEYGCSSMERTAIITDLRLSTDPDYGRGTRPVIVRVVNTHLESLTEGRIARPQQLRLVSALLTGKAGKEDGVHCGIVCGDMNAICTEDRFLNREVGLRDAWRKGDEEEKGFTWGYQGRDVGRFPRARLDKVLFTPRRGLKVDEPIRIGVGVKTPDGKLFVSDHFGLITTMRVLK